MPSIATAALVAAALIGTPPQDSGFCATLKQVVAAAPADFAALNLRPRTPTGQVWDTDVQLDYLGFSCDVGIIGMQPAPRSYDCVSDEAGDPASAEMRTLVGLLTPCLGVPMVETRGEREGGSFFAATLPGSDVLISYSLMISTRRFGPPSIAYYLSLAITPRKA